MLHNDPLEKLFGSKSRVNILKFLINNQGKEFSVNEIIRQSEVNAHLASTELKKLAEIGILRLEKSGNLVLYSTDPMSPWVKPLKDILTEHEWSEWERPSRIHHLILTFEGGLKPMKDYYGYCLSKCYLVFEYDNVGLFFNLREFRDIGRKLVPIYKKNKKRIWADFEKYAATIGTHHDYKSFFKDYVNFWKVGYITEPVSFYIDGLLKPGEGISIDKKSFTEEYENRVWKLARKAEKVGLKNIDFQPFIKDYCWIRNNYHDVHRLTEEEVRAEVAKKMGAVRPKPVSDVPEPISLPDDMAEVGRDMVYMQDRRKMFMMKAAQYLHEYLRTEGKKYGLTPILMDQTIPSEVLAGNKKLPVTEAELKIRQQSCTVICDLTDGIRAFSGKSIYPAGIQKQAKLEIRGNVACGGKAVGRARIVRGAQTELYKVNHGDVIVSPMTTPDFMPAIRRCAAIVTNFGGITCHAAIVAREFNIPCIVGTENATEVIKDNDLIEVDANNGQVRVLRSG